MQIQKYLAKQLGGIRLNAILTVSSNKLTEFEAYFNYCKTLKLNTAQERELEMLGRLIGYIRPLVPNAIILDKLFRFIPYTSAPSFSETGFSSLDGSVDGGNLSDLGEVLESNLLPLAQYRTLLKAVAKIKWNRYSIVAIDQACAIFGSDYSIVWVADHDIRINYTTLSNTNLYVAQLLFNKLFDTTPRVTVARI